MQAPNPKKISTGYGRAATGFATQHPCRFRGSARASPAGDASTGGTDGNRQFGDTLTGATLGTPGKGRFGVSLPDQPFGAGLFSASRFAAASRNRSSVMQYRNTLRSGASGQYIRSDAGRDPGRRFLHRVTGEMGVASRRLDLGVPQQLADHRQALAERQGPAGEAVSEIVDYEHRRARPAPAPDTSGRQCG